MTWRELFKLQFENWGLTFHLGPIVLLVLLVMLFTYVFWLVKKRGWRFRKSWEPVSAEISIGNLGKVTIRPNHETIRIAYRAWIELATRKAGLPFDEEHDVIVEVYNSWYQLFGRLRELAKDIPPQLLRKDKDTQELIRVMLVVLNDGLRPHLTRWHAKFRRWYELQANTTELQNKSPQEIQKKYPSYKELIEDLKKVNKSISEYAALLKAIAGG